MRDTWSLVYRRIHAVSLVGLLLVTAALPVQAADLESLLQSAREHLKQDRASEAYELLMGHELEWAGNHTFDYILGIAALDSGEPGEAIFSLQRLIASQPDFSGARLELARAYYDIGDNELARVEFEKILADNPPENVEAAANQYMSAINDNARAYVASVDFYIDQGFGYDSNAPAATDEALVRIGTVDLTLSDNNLEQSSAFSQTTLGALWNKPLTPNANMMLGVRLDHRINPSTHFVDATNLDLSGGWNYRIGDHGISIMVNTLFSALDQKHNKNVYGFVANYSYKLNDTWSLSTFIQTAALRFEESDLEVRDVDQLFYGVSFSQVATASMLNVTFMGMGDDPKQSGSNFGNDGYGIRVSNSWFRPGGRVYFVEASANRVEYDEIFFDEVDREDDTWTVALGASFAKFPTKNWTATARVSYSKRDSTLSLYEFERLEVGFSVRRLF